MKKLRQLRALRRDRRGASFIEAAVVLPILVIIVCGAFDFGRAFSTLSDAQRDLRTATRFLATLPAIALCGTDQWGLQQARKLALTGKVDNTGTQHLPGWTATDITMLRPTAAECGSAAGPLVVKLNGRIKYEGLIWHTVGIPGTITFSIDHEERWLGE